MHRQKLRICSSGARTPVVSKSTGGSSGKPLQLAIDLRANDRRTAAAYRGYGWAGADPGTRQTHLWGVDLKPASPLRRCKEWLYSRALYRRDILNSFKMCEETIGQFVDRINRYRPEVLVAYTNPLYELARAIDDRGVVMHRPDSIIVGAEKIHDFQRELIEKVFDAPVFETYGSREFTLIGAECELHRGLHLTSELLLVEIVDEDGQTVAAGQEGDIVVTDLFNVAMPFVRYAIGDRGVASPEPCACGRGLPLLQEVVGRKLDVVVTPDGRRVPGEFFPHLIKDFSAIRQFQVVQPRSDQLEIKLVVDSRWTESDRHLLDREVKQCVGQQWMNVTICEVDDIPLTPAGKRRVVIGCGNRTDTTARRA
jgi:phenylacetate-CoA ligase